LVKFEIEDQRDIDEGLEYGQQVQKCVDEADIVLSNEAEYEEKMINSNIEKNILQRYVDLVTQKEVDIEPNPDEVNMSIASSMALKSSCLKRKVGAVICDEKGRPISTGYNEVVEGQPTCAEKYGECYRDKKKNEILNLIQKRLKIPENDFQGVFRTGIKILELCRSIHAEQAAILQSSVSNMKGATVYTTTFPCFNCAKMIVRSGIKKVIYVEPYPIEEAMHLLDESKIKCMKFEGVKARVFYKLFRRLPKS